MSLLSSWEHRLPVCSCSWQQVERWSAFGYVIEERFEPVVDPACSVHGARDRG